MWSMGDSERRETENQGRGERQRELERGKEEHLAWLLIAPPQND